MIIYVDLDTISNKGVSLIKEKYNRFGNKVLEVSGDSVCVEKLQTELNSIYISSSDAPKFRLVYNDKYYHPTIIQVTDNLFWFEKDSYIDAKVRNVEDFINGNIFTLIGEKYNFSSTSNVENTSLMLHEMTNPNVSIEEYLDDKGNYKVFILGRYFSSKHHHSNLDYYSNRLLYNKWGNDNSKHFYKDLIELFLERNNIKYDYIITVPAKRDKDVLELVRTIDAVDLKETYGSLKASSSLQERQELVKGKFQLNQNAQLLENKHLLLIDDIVTTGTTLFEVIDTLKIAKPKSISAVVFGKTFYKEDYELVESSTVNWVCPRCDSPLKVRFAKSDGHIFIGCSNYPNCNFISNNTGDAKQKIYE
ncbi:hypothetical protein HF295_04625 [Hujiaoplasma nucleasis]|uniref:ComF family protein n=1 Tax=Hujiaoplasma nucleasis TaxID=2725268 RepID=A0A7L6N6P3_9MOLU|nr:phosphoribosyltransferase family protein [Hujiaoplasma nucleasis]QLY40184.1 hypothetical protein HF295_04625 [Hujiaoplasma nucleasis]